MNRFDGAGSSQSPRQADAHNGRSAQSAATSAVVPILLNDEQAAAVFGVGLRTFLELQKAAWFPKPRVLGPRLKRHVYSELMAAVEAMPRQQERAEPAQLLRSRIERMKRDGVPA